MAPRSALAHLLDLIDVAFDHKAWHGTTLLGSLRGVAAEQAACRPASDRHNIWEVAVHAAYWKYAVRRRLTGDKRRSFALTGSNWFERPGPADVARGLRRTSLAADWRADIRLLVAGHERLRAAVAAMPVTALDRPIGRERYTAAYLIRGIAAHDLYHAGQIQLLKRMTRGVTSHQARWASPAV
jgi:hypothetical protein